MANTYFDIQTNSNFTPYLGVGIGFGKVHINQPGNHSHDRAFTYQLKAGVGYQFNSSLDFTLGYRYIGIDVGNFDVRGGVIRRQLSCPVVLPQIEITLPGIVTPHHSKLHF